MSHAPRVSVITPVRNGKADIEALLACLEQQTFPREDFEIVIGDDGSTDGGTTGIETPDGHVRVASGPPRNSYATRNMAVEASRGEVLAFCDADCRPEPDWIERGVAALEQTDMVAGRFRFALPDRITPWTLIDMDGSKDHEHQVKLGVAETANLFIRRELFDRLGGLDGSIAEYGDFEFAWRATCAGARLAYAHDAVVWHPTRNSGKPLLRALWKYNRGYAVHIGRAGEVAEAIKLRDWVPIVQTFRSRRKFGRSIGPDRRWLAANDVHPSRLQTLCSLPILYLVVPYLRSAAQLRGWLEGRRLRDTSAPVVPRAANDADVTFSVVVTFYNQREFVADALESILAQDRDDVEIIAVDDCSTDGTAERLLEYDGAVKTVLLEENQGVSAARNAGAAEATGDYLLFLDGDDAFLPWTIGVYEAIARTRRPATMIGSLEWFSGSIPAPADEPREIRFVEYPDYLAKDRGLFPQCGATAIASHAFHEVGGWDPDVRVVEDYDLMWRLGLYGPVTYITEPATALHRAHAGQTTQQSARVIGAVKGLVEMERSGRYPGRGRRSLERRACVGGCVFHWGMVLRHDLYWPSVKLLLGSWSLVLAAVAVRLRARVRGRRPVQTVQVATDRAPVRTGA